MKLRMPFIFILLAMLSSCATKKDTHNSLLESPNATVSIISNASSNTQIDIDRKINETLRVIYFDTNSAILTPQIKKDLNDNIKYLKDHEAVKVQIEGHADERGSIQYNLSLGEKRARNVYNYLAALGINPTRLSIISYGKERPLFLEHNEKSWRKNRRANFVIVDEQLSLK